MEGPQLPKPEAPKQPPAVEKRLDNPLQTARNWVEAKFGRQKLAEGETAHDILLGISGESRTPDF
ncbi:MAG: hypothetical protein HYV37_00300 [Candidatus Levyibacteriota bacterium]|nr:MAG: hypothetical protein HYV37_00300 [Candidatus Levybacteria bacterium]